MNDLEKYALTATCVWSFVGFMFMLNCRKMWNNIATAPSWEGALDLSSPGFKRMSALVSHCCFIIGIIVFSLGSVCIGLRLKLPAPIAVFVGTTGIVSQLLYMVVVGESPIGLPDVHGPPVPARIILFIIIAVQSYAFFTNMSEGVYDDVDFTKVAGLGAFAFGVPNAIALKQRKSTPWLEQPLDAFKTRKSD